MTSSITNSVVNGVMSCVFCKIMVVQNKRKTTRLSPYKSYEKIIARCSRWRNCSYFQSFSE